MKIRFDVVVNEEENSFFIVERPSKQKVKDSALVTLKKIETIVKNKFTYDLDQVDDYSDKTQGELFNILKEKSSEIQKGYDKKQSKLNWLYRKIFSKIKEVKAVHKRIDHYITPPQALPLPTEVIKMVADHLDTSDLRTISQLNRSGKALAETIVLKKANELGYEGSNYVEALKYKKSLFKELKELVRLGIISNKSIYYIGENLEPERILQNLKKELSTDELFKVFSNKKLFSPSFQKARKIFKLKGNWKITKTDSETIKKKGEGAIILSMANGDYEIVELLLQHGVDPNTQLRDGCTLLECAAEAGDEDLVKLLLKYKARVGGSAFAFAFHPTTPNPKVISLLLENGADPNITFFNGSTPLTWAVTSCSEEILKLLLKKGANPNKRCDRNNSALYYACKNGDSRSLRVIKLLLQYGADPNIPSGSGITPLLWAVNSGSVAAVEMLLKRGAKVNEKYSNNTPLVYACQHREKEVRHSMVELLLKYGADSTIPNERGKTPLMSVARAGYKDIVDLFMNY